MTYSVFDIETPLCESFKKKANALDPRSTIICYVAGKGNSLYTEYNVNGINFEESRLCRELPNITCLIGHNIKFDLLHIWGSPSFQNWLKKGGRIFDTQMAEYLLTGQLTTFAKLDDLGWKYLKERKYDVVKKNYWEQGIDTTEVPEELLVSYCKQDGHITEQVARRQQQLLHRDYLWPKALSAMRHILLCCEMEYNGLRIEKDVILNRTNESLKKIQQFEERLNQELPADWPSDAEFKVNSVDHLSAILFGGIVKYTVKEKQYNEDGTPKVYGPSAQKAGQPVYKNENKEVKIKGFGFPTWLTEPSKKTGYYKTDRATLDNFVAKGHNNKFLNNYLNYRLEAKLHSTYYQAPLDCMTPSGIVHTNFNLCRTATGRLSSSAPNVQNIPRGSVVRELYTSRYPNGVMMAIDYSQLEFYILAGLAADQTVIDELAQGLDIHLRNAAMAFNKSEDEVTPAERTASKSVTYGLTYGSGAVSLAERTGEDLEMIKKFIEAFYRKYSAVKQWQEDMISQVSDTRVPTKNKWQGHTIGIGTFRTPFKKFCVEEVPFTYKDRRSGETRTKLTLTPTKPKNYPCQGTAADIMELAGWEVYKFLLNSEYRDKCLLVNEVHDEFLFDVVDKETATLLLPQLSAILIKVRQLFIEHYNFDFGIEFCVEGKYGKSWADCK